MAPRSLLLFLSLGYCLAFASSKTTLPIDGPKSTGVVITSMALTDLKRHDPFANDGRDRSIVISGFSPVSNCRHEHEIAYMPPTTAKFQDAKYAKYGLPNGTVQSLNLKACQTRSNSKKCLPQAPPLVVFSGALATSRMIYNSLLQNIAAAGYLVISIDHPYDADIVEFPDGTSILGAEIEDSKIEDALATRVKDIAFLYQQLARPSVRAKLFPMHRHARTLPKTVVFGHSFGGAATASAMQQMSFIRGGLNIDGTMFGSVLQTGLKRPFMLIGHENKTQATDPSWKQIWPHLTGWKKQVEVKGAAHYSFSDLPLIASEIGIQASLPPQVQQVLGAIEGHQMMNLTVTYIKGFLKLVL